MNVLSAPVLSTKADEFSSPDRAFACLPPLYPPAMPLEETAPAGAPLTAEGVADAEWDALAERSGNVFATREWLSTWQRHHGGGQRTLTLASRDAGGRLTGLLPLRVARRHPALLLPVGPWPPPAGPVICAPEDIATVPRDLAEQLAGRDDWDVLLAQAVPVGAGWREALRAVPRGREPNRTLDFEGRGWDELLAARSRNFREQIGRRERRLRKRYALEYRRSEDPVRLDADLDVLHRLHRLRFGETSTGLTAEREAFHRDIASQALERGWLALWFLELDGRPVAASLDFRYAGSELVYQSGRDPDFEADNVGLALTVHTVREAAGAGVSAYRFLRGDQEYKRRLANRDEPIESLAASRGLVGDLALGAFGVARRARPAVSRALALARG